MIGIGPFTMQVLVPSLPAMGRDLGATMATMQLTVTLYLVGVARGSWSMARCRTASGGGRC